MLIYRLQMNTFSFWLRENFRREAEKLGGIAVWRKINSKSYIKSYVLTKGYRKLIDRDSDEYRSFVREEVESGRKFGTKKRRIVK